MPECSLNQITALAEAIQRDTRINTHFDTSNAFGLLRDISLAQKKLITFLMCYGYYRRSTGEGKNLYQVLERLNFPVKF